jgi:hypothetical protein
LLWEFKKASAGFSPDSIKKPTKTDELRYTRGDIVQIISEKALQF